MSKEKINPKIVTLKNEIELYNMNIEDDENNADAYHMKANALAQLYTITKDSLYAQQALQCYTKAIEVDPTNALYYADRGALHVIMGNPKGAVEDMRAVNSLPQSGSKLTQAYLKNTMRDIAALDEIQTTIKNLQLSGAIPAELAKILANHAGVTANLVVQVGAHGKTLGEHSDEIEKLKSMVMDLSRGKELTDAQIAQLKQNTQGLRSEVENNTAKIQGVEEKAFQAEGKVKQLEDDTAMHEEMIIGMRGDIDILKPVTVLLQQKVESNLSLSTQGRQEMQGMIERIEQSMRVLGDKGANQESIIGKVIARVQELTDGQDFNQQMLTDLCAEVDEMKESVPIGEIMSVDHAL